LVDILHGLYSKRELKFAVTVRAWRKTIEETTFFYVTSYIRFAPSPQRKELIAPGEKREKT